ncbi:MAG TPA: pantoate--beta-alanine ligase [Acidimicrobiales bacterium]|nr:pantoate--beta-alanine ligase [Acidimicrobiales bacterium]
MDEITTIAALRSRLDRDRAAGRTVGFVPTMGYLHDGHASLVRAARADTDVVVASVFVNPLQFGPTEDLAAYPRDLDHDRRVAAAAGVDVLFVPPTTEMYPEPVVTTVTVAGTVTESLEGATRPTHFAGVATVVAKLFNIVGPCRAYFGEKDAQQLAVVRRMVRDLSIPVEVVGCPIVREPDGLALSSRNAYLTAAERAVAPVVHRALLAGADRVAAGADHADEVRAAMAAVLAAEPLLEVDYAEVVDPDTFVALGDLADAPDEVRLLVAARLGRPRLIDNLGARRPRRDRS